MREVLMLSAALAANAVALAWLALAMRAHWRQLRGDQPLPRNTATLMRVLGILGLLLSLGLCLHADHASMAVLVWIMSLAAAALVVAFTLSWRPRVLAPLIAWAPGA